MTKTIPYNTYGTITTRASVTIPASNVPYTYSPLKSDLYIASDLTNAAPKPVITSMYEYAQRNILNYRNITEIPNGHLPEDINTSTAQNWKSAFWNCQNLTSLPEPFYDTSNATDMTSMFYNCSNLTTIPNFDTSNVTNMALAFAAFQKSNLTTVPNFDTSNVTDMYGMFRNQYAIVSLPNFNTSKVTNMSDMLSTYWGSYPDIAIETIPNFDTSNVTNMSNAFYRCNSISYLPNFNTAKVIDFNYVTSPSYNIKYPQYNLNSVNKGAAGLMSHYINPNGELDLPVYIPNVSTAYGLFSDICAENFSSNIYSDIGLNFAKIRSADYMFTNCTNLITLPNFDTSNITSMARMFQYCTNLTTVPNFDTSNVADMSYMFSTCNKLTSVPNFNTSNVIDMGCLFNRCYNLTTVPNFDTSKVVNMTGIFNYCYNLTTIPNFDTSKVYSFQNAFANSGITEIPILNTTTIAVWQDAFKNCKDIQGHLYIECNNVTFAGGLFDNCSTYGKAIYCHANTNTYNAIYRAMGNNTYNSRWNARLHTMEEEDPAILLWTGNGTYRFPTNRVWYNTAWQNYIDGDGFVEITPYADYELYEKDGAIFHNSLNYGEVQWGMSTVPGEGVFFMFGLVLSPNNYLMLEDKI